MLAEVYPLKAPACTSSGQSTEKHLLLFEQLHLYALLYNTGHYRHLYSNLEHMSKSY